MPAVLLGQDQAPVHVGTFDHEYVNWNVARKRTFKFPEAALPFQQVILTITLDCPAGGCDPWDRSATITIKGTDDAGRTDTFEIARFITPYGRGCSWATDVTDYRRLLAGSAELGFRIETYIGGQKGWLVTIYLLNYLFLGGKAPNIPFGKCGVDSTSDALTCVSPPSCP